MRDFRRAQLAHELRIIPIGATHNGSKTRGATAHFTSGENGSAIYKFVLSSLANTPTVFLKYLVFIKVWLINENYVESKKRFVRVEFQKKVIFLKTAWVFASDDSKDRFSGVPRCDTGLSKQDVCCCSFQRSILIMIIM